MSKPYTVAQVIQALRDSKGLMTVAAKNLGCTRKTLYNFVQRYPTVADVVSEEREHLADLAELGLRHHLYEKAPWAIAFVLKSLGRSRGYGDRLPLVTPEPPADEHADDVITIDVRSNGHHPV